MPTPRHTRREREVARSEQPKRVSHAQLSAAQLSCAQDRTDRVKRLIDTTRRHYYRWLDRADDAILSELDRIDTELANRAERKADAAAEARS